MDAFLFNIKKHKFMNKTDQKTFHVENNSFFYFNDLMYEILFVYNTTKWINPENYLYERSVYEAMKF